MQQARSIAAVAAVTVAMAAAPGAGAHTAPSSTGSSAAAKVSLERLTGRLDAAGVRRLGAVRWRSFRAAAAPTVRVSPAYGDAAGIAQRWSSFFVSLIHGPELALLNVYVAPLDEVREICGGEYVLGCYWANRLVIPDQGTSFVSAQSIATHEYGHHVANNRLNPPWTAIDWGSKRWATYEHICPRAAGGTAFPGDEDGAYDLNPGEAFAETYRVLNETSAGLPMTWPIIDASFQPDAAALYAVRQDVLQPWTGPTVTVKRVQLAKGERTWTMQVAAPFDGNLSVQVQPGSDDVTLAAAAAGPPLARGMWGSSGTKAFDYVVCGQRTFVLRVTRNTPARRFTLRLSMP